MSREEERECQAYGHWRIVAAKVEGDRSRAYVRLNKEAGQQAAPPPFVIPLIERASAP
jgi:hypothetical protein